MKMRIYILLFLSFILVSLPVFSKSEDEVFYSAEKAYYDGFYEAAFSLFDRFAKDFPHSKKVYRARFYMAKCLFYQSKYKDSLTILKDLEKQDIDFLDEVYYQLALIYYKGKDYSEAQKYVSLILDNYSSSELFWKGKFLLSKILYDLSNVEGTKELLREIIKKSIDEDVVNEGYLFLAEVLLKGKDYVTLRSLCSQYIKRYPKGRIVANMYFYRGESHYALAEYTNAIKDYERVVKLSDNPQLKDLSYQGMGWSYIEKKDFTKAEDVFKKIKDVKMREFCYGMYYMKKKEFIKALEIWNSFISRFHTTDLIGKVYLSKADTLYQLGRIMDALSVYQFIIDNPNFSHQREIIDKAHYGSAWCYLKKGDFKKALGEFKKTLEYEDDPIVRISSQIQIADVYLDVGKIDEALKLYSQLLDSYPDNIYADYIQFQIGVGLLKKADVDKAILAFRSLINNFPTSMLIEDARYYIGLAYFSNKDYKTAEVVLKELINDFPQGDYIDDAYYLLGKCYFNQGEYNKAIDEFRNVIKISRDQRILELVYIDLGDVYIILEKDQQAISVWRKFLDKFSNSSYAPTVALSIGGVFEKNNNFEEAERYYKFVLEKYPDYATEALISLGHLTWKNNELEKAKDYFKRVIDKGGLPSLKAKLYLAQVYAYQEDIAKALKMYDSLITSDTEFSNIARVRKALLLKDQGEYKEAISLLKTAIKKGLDSAQIRFYLAFCLEKLGKIKDALEEYFKLIYVFDNKEYKIKAYFRIARLYEKENSIEEAIKVYRKIMEMDVKESGIAKERLDELLSKR